MFIPHENDLELIRYYAQILLNGTVKKSIQPLLYMIAVHHLNGFIFDQTRTDQKNLQKIIMKNLQTKSVDDQVYFNFYLYKKAKILCFSSRYCITTLLIIRYFHEMDLLYFQLYHQFVSTGLKNFCNDNYEVLFRIEMNKDKNLMT